jgi:hypothetical protein
MSQVSRPMQILLAATLLVGVVWFVALRPKASGETGASSAAHQAPTAPGVNGLTTAIDKAHQGAATANADAQRATGTSADASAPAATTGSGTPAATAAPTHARHVARAHHVRLKVHAGRTPRTHAHTPAGVRTVNAALRRHRAIAIAFVSSTVADARAVAVEMRHVGRFGGRAVTLSVPIAQLSSYDAITRTVQITGTPTIVIVAPNGDATTIVGFADRTEIEQRLADALAKHRR